MYRPDAFEVADSTVLLSALAADRPATLVTVGVHGLESTILPVLYDPQDGPLGTITGHVARGNPLVRPGGAAEAIVVVTGPEAYISPGWYASKAEHGKVVPTWDYVTVEAAGPLVLHHDPTWLLDLVTRLTDRHEEGFGEPWAVNDAPDDFVAANLRAIVGIEIRVGRLAGKAKLSQNRPPGDIAGVIAGLRSRGALQAEVADAVTAATRVDGEDAESDLT